MSRTRLFQKLKSKSKRLHRLSVNVLRRLGNSVEQELRRREKTKRSSEEKRSEYPVWYEQLQLCYPSPNRFGRRRRCPCGGFMRIRQATGSRQFFFGCSNYPRCCHTEELKIVTLPLPVKRQQKRWHHENEIENWASIGEPPEYDMYPRRLWHLP